MAVYALTSISGSPGVTTAALAWALHASRPTLVIEADVTGGSAILAGFWQGAMAHTKSLSALAGVAPELLGEALWEQAVALPDAPQRWVVPAIGRSQHVTGMQSVWSPLMRVLRSVSEREKVDVLIDAGRLGSAGGPWPLIEGADAVLLLTHATLPALNAVALALPTLRSDLDLTGSHRRLGVVPVLSQGAMRRSLATISGQDDDALDVRPYSVAEISATTAPTPVIAPLPYDARSAGTYLHGLPEPRRGVRHPYTTYLRRLITATATHAHSYREFLAQETNG